MQLEKLKGIGPKSALALRERGIKTCRDLLFFFPNRYEDKTQLQTLSLAKEGDWVQVVGTLEKSWVRFGNRRSLLCKLDVQGDSLQCVFFHFHQQQAETFKSHKGLVQVYGQLRHGRSGFEMAHPQYRCIDTLSQVVLEETLSPVYPTIDGVKPALLRKAIASLLLQQTVDFLAPEWLDEALCESEGLMSLPAALMQLHAPTVLDLTAARKRLLYEEVLQLQMGLLSRREKLLALQAPCLTADDLCQRFLSALPFELTPGQMAAVDEIQQDLLSSQPMLRLLQGDVGSGKTVVAIMAALRAIASGVQVAMMAPTTLLAEQLGQKCQEWLLPLGVRVAVLTGSGASEARSQQVADVASGHALMIVGTHALFQASVSFANLGLVIIDEQHRFGVLQRDALCQKGAGEGCYPHLLMMSATPIPRTVAMTAYADLDVSRIEGLPLNRQPITTVLISSDERDVLMSRLKGQCERGHQVYWVCPLIDVSDKDEEQAAVTQRYAELTRALSGVSVGWVHGQLSADDKAAAMTAFAAGDTQLLVATTVIEVGVDVPQATVMVIENAERLGLAQLHQLRGRVGRGAEKSYCLLLYTSPLTAEGRERLSAIRETQDGFLLSELDLAQRGPGELLGARQAGLWLFKSMRGDLDEEIVTKACTFSRKAMKGMVYN